MDLIKIGKYIAGKRKEQNMTQKQLAEKLGMSDKSVSKWERGICLPDISVYEELCHILGISINEFIAGEDIARENLVKKSDENIIDVATDGKRKQRRLKMIILTLLIITILSVVMIFVKVYQEGKPQNFITPVAKDSIEMQTAELLAGPDGAFVYKFTTTDNYTKLRFYISKYQSGKLVDKQSAELGYEGIGSPENGEILIVPDFDNFKIKLVAASESGKVSTEIPILDGVEGREYFGRTATEIEGKTQISYNEEQPLLALIYDKNEISVPKINDLMDEQTDFLSENDYVYAFSFEFCKE